MNNYINYAEKMNALAKANQPKTIDAESVFTDFMQEIEDAAGKGYFSWENDVLFPHEIKKMLLKAGFSVKLTLYKPGWRTDSKMPEKGIVKAIWS